MEGTACTSACNQLQAELNELFKNIETKKTISPHSKPWMNPDISQKVDELREYRKRFSRHRSERNSLLLDQKREEVCAQLALVRQKWVLEQSARIPYVSEKEKFRLRSEVMALFYGY